MSIDVSKIGARIRAARQKAGFSQPQFARLAEVAEMMLNTWELGKTIPTIDSLRKVSQALGIPISELLED